MIIISHEKLQQNSHPLKPTKAKHTHITHNTEFIVPTNPNTPNPVTTVHIYYNVNYPSKAKKAKLKNKGI